MTLTTHEPSTPQGVAIQLAKGFALSEFYPLTHPTLAQALQKTERDLLALGSEFRMEVSESGFVRDGEPLARRSPHATRLAARLHEHGVTTLGVRADIGADGLGRFLSAAALPPRMVRAAGGFVAVLTAAGAGGVSIDGTRLNASHVDAAVQTPPAPAGVEAGIQLWSAHDAYEQVRQSADRVGSEDIQELRRVLREAPDSERLEALQRLEYVAHWYIEQGQFDLAIALIQDLRRDAEAMVAKSPGPRGHVMLAIHRVANRPVIDELVTRLGRSRSDEERTGLRATLLHVGADVVSPLVHALTNASDVSARRAYRDALVALDHVGVPLLEEMTGDERWFVVRNMVGILAEIRSADALDHFTRTIGHSDSRVRRETILALTKLGDEDVVPLLVRGLSDSESGLRGAAALGLGLTKSGAAVQPLLDQLTAEGDMEVQLEILRALGRIGDARAIPALMERAGTGGWFSRTPTPLRAEATRALGEIRDEAAHGMLQRLLRDRVPEVRDAAVKALG